MMRQVMTFAALAKADMSFEEFKQTYGKEYNGVEEEAHRAAVFSANLERINSHNAQQQSYTMAVNQFADLTEVEFVAQYTGAQPTAREDAMMGTQEFAEVEEAVDWVQRGAVNPIKNQGQCGSCWAFSTVGTLESAYQIATGQLVNAAEQQLVDCDTSNDGCDGGWPYRAYDQYITGHGMCTTSSYSYTARDGSCQASYCTVAIPQGTVTGHQNVQKTSSALKAAIAQQPVSVTVNAGDMQFYANGVVTGGCSGSINHAVMAVGYGVDGQDYFKIRNSWGTGWGEAGYIRLAQNSYSSEGTACLLQVNPVVPTLSTTVV